VLLVVAHPLDNAFAKAAAARIRATLQRRGIEVDMIDLYADDFDPCLTGAERRGYFTTPYDSKAVAGYVARLRLAEKLVFVFPQWWFNVPAILKGFFDRRARRCLRPPFGRWPTDPAAHSRQRALGGELDRRTLVGHAILHGRPGPPPDCPRHPLAGDHAPAEQFA
jgi:multimeric flavodoxin WrbA